MFAGDINVAEEGLEIGDCRIGAHQRGFIGDISKVPLPDKSIRSLMYLRFVLRLIHYTMKKWIIYCISNINLYSVARQ